MRSLEHHPQISPSWTVQLDNAEFLEKRRFIIKLGKALHKFGTPAYRLEAHLQSISKVLGIEGYFLISPTSMTFVLQHDTDQEYNHMRALSLASWIWAPWPVPTSWWKRFCLASAP